MLSYKLRVVVSYVLIFARFYSKVNSSPRAAVNKQTNKEHKLAALKEQKFIHSQSVVLEAEGYKSRCRQRLFLLKCWGSVCSVLVS